MEGNQKVDELILPVKSAIRRHVKNSDAFTDIYNRAYEALMRQVDDAAALRAELAALKDKMRWIPVGERLPDDNDDVLVWRVEGYHEIGCHSSGLWWGGTVMDEAIDVTHWMPLQEPPEVEHD